MKRKNNQERLKNLTVIKRSNKVFQALNLPTVLNLNPRSVYNKVKEFITFVEEKDIDLVCMSESWEREDLPLDNIIEIDKFEIISNVFQRTGQGGRPAIFANKRKYHVENLTQSTIQIPWGLEIVWAVITPKKINRSSKIQKIMVASVYCKPDSRRKSDLLDHIAEVFHLMNSKYARGLHWLICGDTNDLKLDGILHLSPNLKQVVQHPTRLNPPRLLDPIITTLSGFYQVPQCLPPLDNDPDKNGKPSDHLMVEMKPIASVDNESARQKLKITFRPFTPNSFSKMKDWIEIQDWSIILIEESAHKKMELLQNLLFKKYEEFFPLKTKVVTSEDQPFFSQKLKMMRRRKVREYIKNRKSKKWHEMNKEYQVEVKRSKMMYYAQKIKQLGKNKPKYWYRELKKLTGFGQEKFEEVNVESIKDMTPKKQVEQIADKFASVSQEYEALKTEDITIPHFTASDIPIVNSDDVSETIESMDINKSSIIGDIPVKILKYFAKQISFPMTDVLNTSIKQGCWPNIFKLEIVTPVPKVPKPKNMDDLRNISGLLNLSKVSEKIISKLFISDMKENIDPSQFGNQTGISIQHYLINFIDRILASTDEGKKRESLAVLATLVDWKEAFPRQCPKLGIESFIQNGVRPALIPLMINFFQGRQMKVKWHGQLSEVRDLKGGGPQGSTFGIWEYLSQSNDNANCINPQDRFKFVDDLSFIEVIKLLSVGMASYNTKVHVPSNIPSHNQIIPAKHLKSQQYLNIINNWTKKKKMKLNEKKTKNIIFNFSKKFQFHTSLSVNEKEIEVVNETKLLGTFITNDLKWNKNTSELVKKANKRMLLLSRAATFTSNSQDLKRIYLTYIRSIVDQSAVVWHSSLTKKNRNDIERIQKVAVRIILGKNYTNYNEGLKQLRLQNLNDRRENACLKFAQKCIKNDKVKNMFPISAKMCKRSKRKSDKFKVKFIRTKRYRQSAIPYMVNLLNINNRIKKNILKKTK